MKTFSKTLSVVFLLSLMAPLLSACSPPVTCAPGTQSCPCREGGACNEGLTCGADQKCGSAVAAGVQFDAAARACEFVLTESAGTQVLSVDFGAQARGAWVRQAPQVAITVVAGADAPLGSAVQLGLTGPTSNLTLSKASCVDVTGQRLTSTLSLR
jgi:hypothetical protein